MEAKAKGHQLSRREQSAQVGYVRIDDLSCLGLTLWLTCSTNFKNLASKWSTTQRLGRVK